MINYYKFLAVLLSASILVTQIQPYAHGFSCLAPPSSENLLNAAFEETVDITPGFIEYMKDDLKASIRWNYTKKIIFTPLQEWRFKIVLFLLSSVTLFIGHILSFTEEASFYNLIILIIKPNLIVLGALLYLYSFLSTIRFWKDKTADQFLTEKDVSRRLSLKNILLSFIVFSSFIISLYLTYDLVTYSLYQDSTVMFIGTVSLAFTVFYFGMFLINKIEEFSNRETLLILLKEWASSCKKKLQFIYKWKLPLVFLGSGIFAFLLHVYPGSPEDPSITDYFRIPFIYGFILFSCSAAVLTIIKSIRNLDKVIAMLFLVWLFIGTVFQPLLHSHISTPLSPTPVPVQYVTIDTPEKLDDFRDFFEANKLTILKLLETGSSHFLSDAVGTDIGFRDIAKAILTELHLNTSESAYQMSKALIISWLRDQGHFSNTPLTERDIDRAWEEHADDIARWHLENLITFTRQRYGAYIDTEEKLIAISMSLWQYTYSAIDHAIVLRTIIMTAGKKGVPVDASQLKNRDYIEDLLSAIADKSPFKLDRKDIYKHYFIRSNGFYIIEYDVNGTRKSINADKPGNRDVYSYIREAEGNRPLPHTVYVTPHETLGDMLRKAGRDLFARRIPDLSQEPVTLQLTGEKDYQRVTLDINIFNTPIGNVLIDGVGGRNKVLPGRDDFYEWDRKYHVLNSLGRGFRVLNKTGKMMGDNVELHFQKVEPLIRSIYKLEIDRSP